MECVAKGPLALPSGFEPIKVVFVEDDDHFRDAIEVDLTEASAPNGDRNIATTVLATVTSAIGRLT